MSKHKSFAICTTLCALLLVGAKLYGQAAGSSSEEDRVFLKNGDRISGTLTWIDKNSVVIKTKSPNAITEKTSDVDRVEIQRALVLKCVNCPTSLVNLAAGTTIKLQGASLELSIGDERSEIPLIHLVSIQPTTGCNNPNRFMCGGWQLEKLKFTTNILGATQKQQTYGAELGILNNWNPASVGWPHQRSSAEIAASYDDKRQNAISKANITQNYSGTFQHLFFASSNNVFGALVSDLYHNNSQGIYFQQAYGGGGGFTSGGLEIDADLRFLGEHFYKPGTSLGLVGSRITESYDFDLSTLVSGMHVVETGSVTPVFNKSRAWQSQGRIDLFVPFTKTLGLAVTADDNYVENTPQSFRQNYFKLSIGFQFSPAKK